ncbi:MAG: hypothetical protein AAF799_18955 [Myxococcota bacterium]
MSPGLAEKTEEIPVVKLDRKSWNVGAYEVREIRRGWEKSGGISIGPVSGNQKQRDFSFQVNHSGTILQVRCELSSGSSAIAGFTVSDGEQMTCDLNPSDASAAWKVIIVARGTRNASGRLQQGDNEMPIVSAHGSGHSQSRGYLIRQEGDVAAADVRVATRRVWVPKEGETSFKVAYVGAAVTLMLFEELAESSNPSSS